MLQYAQMLLVSSELDSGNITVHLDTQVQKNVD